MQTAGEFSNRVAVVTGASSGIGKATAEMLVSRGARVAIFARSKERLAAVARKHGDAMIAVAGDVADAASIERLFQAVESKFGACDLLVNNAGMVHPKLLVDEREEDWDRLFAVNVRGAYLATRRALPAMIERRRGTIVNVSSISGVLGPQKFPGFVSYCASKAALIMMTEALSIEVAEHGIRVNCVSPGAVDTPMWDSVSGGEKASMTPEEVAESILFLLSERSRPMNGQNLHVYSA